MLNHDINRLGVVLDEMAAIAGDSVKVTVTVSADEAELPPRREEVPVIF